MYINSKSSCKVASIIQNTCFISDIIHREKTLATVAKATKPPIRVVVSKDVDDVASLDVKFVGTSRLVFVECFHLKQHTEILLINYCRSLRCEAAKNVSIEIKPNLVFVQLFCCGKGLFSINYLFPKSFYDHLRICNCKKKILKNITFVNVV